MIKQIDNDSIYFSNINSLKKSINSSVLILVRDSIWYSVNDPVWNSLHNSIKVSIDILTEDAIKKISPNFHI